MSYRYRKYRGRERPQDGSLPYRSSREYRSGSRKSYVTEQAKKQYIRRAVEQLSREERRELQKLDPGRRQQILQRAFERADNASHLDGLHRDGKYRTYGRAFSKDLNRSYRRKQNKYLLRYRAETEKKRRSDQYKTKRTGNLSGDIASSLPGTGKAAQSPGGRAAGKQEQIRSYVVLKGTARKQKVPVIRSAKMGVTASELISRQSASGNRSHSSYTGQKSLKEKQRQVRLKPGSTTYRPVIYREIIPGEKRIRIRWYYYLSPDKDTSRLYDRADRVRKARKEKTVSHLQNGQKEKHEKAKRERLSLSAEKTLEQNITDNDHRGNKDRSEKSETGKSGNRKRNKNASTAERKRNKTNSTRRKNTSSGKTAGKSKSFQASLKQEISGLIKSEIKKAQRKEEQKKEYRRQMTMQAMEEDERRLVLSRMYGAGKLLKAAVEKLKKAASLILAKKKALLLFAAVPLMLVVIMTPLLIALISMTDEEETYTATGMEIVSYASEWIGVTKYVWGAGRASETDWQDYTDCSGFVHGVFAHFGYEIGGDTVSMENAGTLVASNTLEGAMPGDIVLFFSGSVSAGYSSHVGIYAGEGQMIHCSGGRANTSPANAGPGVEYGFVEGDGRPYQVRRIIMDAGALGGTGTGGHRVDATSYSQADMELIWAIVAQEDNGSYEGALAVISSAMNRCESPSWSSLGSNALAQLKAPGQYCYSNDRYWVSRLGGNVPIYVKSAVNDCLVKGIRNHSFTSFRSTKGSTTGPDAVQIGGNWFFGH